MKIRWLRLSILLALLAAGVPFGAAAKPGFGEKVDAYCSSLGRGTPFADLAGQGFLSECSLCHQFTYPPQLPDKSNTYDPPAAEFLAAQRSGNYGYFCPGVTNQPPAITPIADQSVNPAEMLVIDVFASDPDGDPLALSVANAPAGSSFVDHQDGSGTFTWTPGSGDLGSHSIDFLAQDDAVPPGQALEAVTVTVGSSNRPPVLAPIGPRAGDPGVPLEITVTASDPDGDALQLSAAPLPAGADFVAVTDGSALFTWTPDASQLGNHVVTFEVQDGSDPVGSDSEAVTLTIGQVNAPPVLAPIGDRSVTAGEALAIALGAQDPDGDALAFSAAGLPAGALLSDAHDGTGSLDWSPTEADVGTYDVTLSVADDGSPPESDSETFTVTVQPASAPSAVRIDDAHWKPGKRRGGKLHVRGSGAHPREPIGVLDADSGLVLGSKKANRRGGFTLKVQPMIVPCEVQVQAGDVRSAPVPVRGAPADCGQAIQLEVEARWKCADPEHPAEDEDAGLRVHGEHAPAGAAIEIRDAASGGVLATAQADSAGRFEVQAAAPAPPRAIDVRVSAGGLDWSFDAVPVRAESCDDDAADDDADGEAERAE